MCYHFVYNWLLLWNMIYESLLLEIDNVPMSLGKIIFTRTLVMQHYKGREAASEPHSKFAKSYGELRFYLDLLSWMHYTHHGTSVRNRWSSEMLQLVAVQVLCLPITLCWLRVYHATQSLLMRWRFHLRASPMVPLPFSDI
jgi:hypothetical protein